MSGTRFNWLHLTDLHFGSKDQPGRIGSVIGDLLNDLSDNLDDPIDLVVFTGDLVNRGTSEQYDELSVLLKRLFGELSKSGVEPFFLAVPGNHDLVRPGEAEDIAVEYLRDWGDPSKHYCDNFSSNEEHILRKVVRGAFGNYEEWWDNVDLRRPEKFHSGLLPGDFSATITKDDISIGVVGLNSTFVQLGKGDYEKKLAVHPNQFGTLIKEPHAWVKKHHFRILLTHQPRLWLCKRALEEFDSFIGRPDYFHLHLCGHLHDTNYSVQGTCEQGIRRTWQGRSLFSTQPWQNATGEMIERSHGYAIGRVRIDVRSDRAGLIFWPRTWNNKPATPRMAPDPEIGLLDGSQWTEELEMPLSASPAKVRRLGAEKLLEGSPTSSSGLGGTESPGSGKWFNLPARDPLFTGRDQLFSKLDSVLEQTNAVSLFGLPGMGKTEMAIEFAYRHSVGLDDYNIVLYVNADSHEALAADLSMLRRWLDPTAPDLLDHRTILGSVHHWLLTNSGWLLIVNDLQSHDLIRDLLPAHCNGHVIVTTRLRDTVPFAEDIEVVDMCQEDGVRFLLKRSHLGENASSEDKKSCEKIWKAVGGTPLVLDYAGAYIHANGRTPDEFYRSYQKHGKHHRSGRGKKSIAITYRILLEAVKHESQAAITLLKVFAHLDSEAIPESILTVCSTHMQGCFKESAPNREFNLQMALDVCRKYSLLRWDDTSRTYIMHCLVQQVISDRMGSERSDWAGRAVSMMNCAFPLPELKNWELCGRLLTHAIKCSEHIKKFKLAGREAGHLLSNLAVYLGERAHYDRALPLLSDAARLLESACGREDVAFSEVLRSWARMHYFRGDSDKVEPLLLEALSLQRECLEPTDVNLMRTLNNLATFYRDTARYREALELYQEALDRPEDTSDELKVERARSLNGLGVMYRDLEQFDKAAQLFEEARLVRNGIESLNRDYPATLNNVGMLYRMQGKWTEAEKCFREACSLLEKTFGSDNPRVARSLNGLGEVLLGQERFDEAELVFQRAFNLRVGLSHPDDFYKAWTLNGQGIIHLHRKMFSEARQELEEALRILECNCGLDHPYRAMVLGGYYSLLCQTNAAAEAIAAMDDILRIRELHQMTGPDGQHQPRECDQHGARL